MTYRPQDLVTVILSQVDPCKVEDRCYLCRASIPKDGCPLCPECELDQREKEADYREEQEQKRRPL